MHPLTLSFPRSDIEANFLKNYHEKNLTRLRVSLVLGLILYSLFAVLDSLSVGPLWPRIWFIRFALVDPILIIALVLTFVMKKVVVRRYQQVGSFVILAAGLGIVAMLAMIPAPAQYLYSQGLMLVLIYNYAFIGLRFIYASFNFILIIISFEIVSIGINPLPSYAFISNNFFLISGSIIGMAVAYYLEKLNRENFIHGVSLRKIAETDALTGVLNRGFFMEEAKEKLALMAAFDGHRAFCLLDLDGFKEINDRQGHVAGDEILKNFGRALTNKMRSTDLIGRVGGDEFGFFFEEVKNLWDLYSIFGKLKDEFSRINQAGERPASFSVGCLYLGPEPVELLSAYSLADKALLGAKRRKNSILIIDSRENVLQERIFN